MHGRWDHQHIHGQTHPPGAGHNGHSTEAAQWQTPHIPEGEHADEHRSDETKDLDLIEKAFVEGFATTSDPTSFLRLAGVPFTGISEGGFRLNLLRVEQNASTDLGSLTPALGGSSFRYDPLPARMTSRRSDLHFVYHDGEKLVRLSLEDAKALSDQFA